LQTFTEIPTQELAS